MQLHHDILFWNPSQRRYNNLFYEKRKTEIAFKIMIKYASQQERETEVQNTHQKSQWHTSKLQPLVIHFSQNQNQMLWHQTRKHTKILSDFTSVRAICGTKVLNLLFCLFPELIFLSSLVCWTVTLKLFLWKVVPMIWQRCLWLLRDKHLHLCPLFTSHLPIQTSSIWFTFAHQQPHAHTQIFFGSGPKTFTLIFITWLLWHMSFQTSHISVIMQMRWNITPLQQMARDDNNGSTEEIQCPWLYRHGNNNLKYM